MSMQPARTVAPPAPKVVQLTLTDYLMLLIATELEARRREVDRMQHGTFTITCEIKGGMLNLMEVTAVEKKTKHTLDALFAAIPAMKSAY